MSNSIDESISKGRLMSLDALRGLDMIFLVGISGVFLSLPKLSDNAVFNFLANQCHHTPWHGFHIYDFIFPLFIFIVGAGMPFAISKRLQDGFSRKNLYIHIIRRSLILFILGLFFNRSLLSFDYSQFLFTGVLQRIAIAYFFAALIVINFTVKKQAIIAPVLLVIYWLLMILVPVPGYGAGVLTPEGNLHTYIDQLLLPGKLGNGFYDEDGILQQISSIAVCLFGVLAGHCLKSSNAPDKKVLGLLGAGVASILIAFVWNLSFPIIFRLWSSSYAMLVIGLSSLLLGLFCWLIDVKGYKRWAFPFVVVGLNSITIYLVAGLFDFGIIVNIFVYGFVDYLGAFKPVFLALCILIVEWLFLWFLYKQKIFLKV